ncbi:Thymidylate synthase thyX (plasmid) [Borrelia hermsii MTW]|uniref:Thymidylate synthase thyX n=1 Tax=Borrelia hermsii MTW TaxID=1313291 RepID=W5T6T0_BORHE|nr:Thymidylate synthase thyX [Borrelia hermsii MTW]
MLNTEIEKESLLNQEYKVLDKGFLKSIDYMGSNARISYRGEKH